MNFEQLRAWYWIVRTGSFTEAAKVLGVSQPAISKRIRLLDDGLWDNGPTEKGVGLYNAIEEMVALYEELDKETRT